MTRDLADGWTSRISEKRDFFDAMKSARVISEAWRAERIQEGRNSPLRCCSSCFFNRPAMTVLKSLEVHWSCGRMADSVRVACDVRPTLSTNETVGDTFERHDQRVVLTVGTNVQGWTQRQARRRRGFELRRGNRK